MSPRVKPKALSPEFQAHLDEEFGKPTSSFYDGAYGPGSDRSWFLDAAFANADAAVLREMLPLPTVGSQSEAMERLTSVNGRERRDLTTTATAGGNFVPSGSPPSYVAEAFAVGARSAAVLASSLRSEPLPETGMTVTTGRLTTGGTAVVQASENAATSETDPVTATSSSPVATIAGQLDASQQLFDRADPGIDRVLAEDLGAAWGSAFDAQVLNGTGSNSQLTGLLVLSGTTAITASTATAVANLAAAGKLRADVSTTFGQAADTLILHPRRAAFIRATLGYAPDWPIPNLVEAPAMPVTLSSTQDALVAIIRDQVILYTAPPVIRVMPDVGSNTLTVRVSAFAYAAMVARQPAAVGKATGAGLAAPSWTL